MINKTLNDRFGQLRSAAHSLSGESRWEALVKQLEDWPHEHLAEVVLPYLHALLLDDPSPREAPERWFTPHPEAPSFHPAWSLVTKLTSINRELTPQQVIALASSEQLQGLTALNISADDINDEGVQALALSPHLRQLRSLELSHANLSAESAIAIAGSPHLLQLNRLVLNLNFLQDQGALAIAHAPNLSTLTELHLYGGSIRKDGAYALASSAHLKQLTTLDLRANPINDAEKYALEHDPTLHPFIQRAFRR